MYSVYPEKVKLTKDNWHEKENYRSVSIVQIFSKMRYFNFELSLKLGLCRARNLLRVSNSCDHERV